MLTVNVYPAYILPSVRLNSSSRVSRTLPIDYRASRQVMPIYGTLLPLIPPLLKLTRRLPQLSARTGSLFLFPCASLSSRVPPARAVLRSFIVRVPLPSRSSPPPASPLCCA